MQIAVNVNEEIYSDIMFRAKNTPRDMDDYDLLIANGTPLPNSFSEENKFTMFDLGIFNNIVQGYISIILDKMNNQIKESDKDYLKTAIYYAFDRYSAKEAEDIYREYTS